MADPYLDPDGVRARISDGSPALDKSDEWIAEQVAVWEATLEDHTGDAYVVREAEVTLSVSSCTGRVVLPNVHVSDVTCTADGTAVTLDEHQPDLAAGIVRYASGVHPSQTLVFSYSYGHAEIPVVVPVATARYVERQAALDRSGSTRDISRQGFDGGSTVYVMPDPENGKLTGFDEIDSLVRTLPRYLGPGVA